MGLSTYRPSSMDGKEVCPDERALLSRGVRSVRLLLAGGSVARRTARGASGGVTPLDHHGHRRISGLPAVDLSSVESWDVHRRGTDAGEPLAGDVIGRESELAILHRFLDSIPTGPSALLLSGDPGIGKTTVWKEGLAGARPRGYRTLACGPVEAETRLSYAALGDLLEPILDVTLPTVPEPQREALEVALLRSSRSRRPSRPARRLPGRARLPAFARPRPLRSCWPSTTSSGWTFLRSGCSSSSCGA